MSPMPIPPAEPTKPYVLAGKVQYNGSDISGAKIWIENETVAGSSSLLSSEVDSNFAANLADLSAWTNGNIVSISATHNGRRGTIKTTVNSANFGEDIGIIKLKSNWGCFS